MVRVGARIRARGGAARTGAARRIKASCSVRVRARVSVSVRQIF